MLTRTTEGMEADDRDLLSYWGQEGVQRYYVTYLRPHGKDRVGPDTSLFIQPRARAVLCIPFTTGFLSGLSKGFTLI